MTPGTPARRSFAVPLALAVTGLLAAFLAGRWTTAGGVRAAATPRAEAAVQDPYAEVIAAQRALAASQPLARSPAPTATSPAALAPAPAGLAPAAPLSPAALGDLQGRVRDSARGELELQRPYIVSRCWPTKGLPGGRESARLVFSLTFDAQGREIARGVSEDRRAPAGAFGRCLRLLRGTELSVPAPGRNVGVAFAMSFP
jgi:hypothetical protein